jgi:hypothetical protein
MACSISKKSLSFSALLSWVLQTKFASLVPSSCRHGLTSLSTLLDQSNLELEPRVLLEIHHDSDECTEISLFGNTDILSVVGIEYPSFINYWRDNKTSACVDSPHQWNLTAEFDFYQNSYKLMGLFQRYPRTDTGLHEMASTIEYYICSRMQELQIIHKSSSFNHSLDHYYTFIDQLGEPDWIGFLDRGGCVIKLVRSISIDQIPKTIRFCNSHYAHVIESTLGDLSTFEDMLRSLISSHQLVRISVDIDLLSSSYLNRLSFECSPMERVCSKQCNQQKADLTFDYHKYFSSFMQSERIANNLPYGLTRLSLNLVDHESLRMYYMHRKLSLSEHKTKVKDYLFASLSSPTTNEKTIS